MFHNSNLHNNVRGTGKRIRLQLLVETEQ